jgi:carbamoylphosphate synthase large subunit
MDQALQRLIAEGKITPRAAYEKAADKELFARLMKEKGEEVPEEAA